MTWSAFIILLCTFLAWAIQFPWKTAVPTNTGCWSRHWNNIARNWNKSSDGSKILKWGLNWHLTCSYGISQNIKRAHLRICFQLKFKYRQCATQTFGGWVQSALFSKNVREYCNATLDPALINPGKSLVIPSLARNVHTHHQMRLYRMCLNKWLEGMQYPLPGSVIALANRCWFLFKSGNAIEINTKQKTIKDVIFLFHRSACIHKCIYHIVVSADSNYIAMAYWQCKIFRKGRKNEGTTVNFVLSLSNSVLNVYFVYPLMWW